MSGVFYVQDAATLRSILLLLVVGNYRLGAFHRIYVVVDLEKILKETPFMPRSRFRPIDSAQHSRSSKDPDLVRRKPSNSSAPATPTTGGTVSAARADLRTELAISDGRRDGTVEEPPEALPTR